MTKKVEKQIQIDADAATVWKALSEGEELKRWFPLDARVKPGEGGSVWMSFGEGAEWESPIEIWKPNEQLRTADTIPTGEGTPPIRIAVDYIIESKGGSTILRLIHSGFADDAWDDEIDSLNAGWMTFLENLKHYLERHRGEPRALAFFRHPAVAMPRSEVFPRVMKALGLSGVETLQPGERYSASSENGLQFQGIARVVAPPINFTGTVENLGNGSVMVEVEPGRETCRPSIWLSLYGDMRSRAGTLQEQIRDLLTGAFTAS